MFERGKFKKKVFSIFFIQTSLRALKFNKLDVYIEVSILKSLKVLIDTSRRHTFNE